MSKQTDESLRMLVNDVGLITNPSLRIAASVASETLKLRAENKRLREALSYYADGDNWGDGSCDLKTEIDDSDIFAEGDYFFGGKRAREALKG